MALELAEHQRNDNLKDFVEAQLQQLNNTQPATPAQADIRKETSFRQPPLPNRKEH